MQRQDPEPRLLAEDGVVLERRHKVNDLEEPGHEDQHRAAVGLGVGDDPPRQRGDQVGVDLQRRGGQ